MNVTEETVQEVSEVATSEAMITEEVTQKTQEATVTEVKINAPSAPKNLAVQEATESGVTIQWEQPEEDGGAPVKEYMVSVKEESKKKFKKIGTVSATETSFTITELQEDKAYEVQVVAVNEAGPSEKAATLQEPIKVPTRTVGFEPHNYEITVYSISKTLMHCIFKFVLMHELSWSKTLTSEFTKVHCDCALLCLRVIQGCFFNIIDDLMYM